MYQVRCICISVAPSIQQGQDDLPQSRDHATSMALPPFGIVVI